MAVGRWLLALQRVIGLLSDWVAGWLSRRGHDANLKNFARSTAIEQWPIANSQQPTAIGHQPIANSQ
jgi:hypothetical protein